MIIEIISAIAFVASVSVFNKLRGSGTISKYVPLLFIGLTSFLYTSDAIVACITTLGLIFWAGDGWKRGLTALHGWTHVFVNNEGYKFWIDKPLSLIYNPHNYVLELPVDDRVKRYGTYWMSLRGLYIVPLFVALGIYNDSWHTGVILGLEAGLAMGGIYYAAGKISEVNGHTIAEFAYGFLVGGLLIVSYNVHAILGAIL